MGNIMKCNIDYKPKNKITNPCEFLTEEKVIQYRENSRNKRTSLMQREHKCLKRNKVVTVNNDCIDCEFYKNYVEIIEQQAKRIEELKQLLENR